MTGMHAPTLLLMVVIISFAWALALASVGLPRKKDLILCALAMALHGVAYVCFAQTGKAPPFVPVVLGNTAILGSLVLLVEIFLDLRAVPARRWWWAPVVVLPLAFVFLQSPSHLALRVAMASAVFGGLCVWLGWLLCRPHPALPGRGRYIALTGVLLVLLIFVLRLHGALTEQHPALSFRDASFLQSFTIMAALVGMTLLVLGVLLMSEARLAKALVLSHTNYRLLVENASEGIVVAQSGRVQFANPMLLSWLGYTADDVLGQNLLQFVHEDDRAKVLESYNLRVQGLAQGFGMLPRLGHIDVVKQHGKLLAAQTHRHVQRPARRIQEQAADPLQDAVASLMAVVIVVGLEVIDIAQQQCQAALLALGLTPQALELPVETAPVVQPGKAVLISQHPHQATDQKMLARLELQQIAADRAHQVAEQQKQAVIDQTRHGYIRHQQFGGDIGQQDQQGADQGLKQTQADQKVGRHAHQQQPLVGVAWVDPMRQADHQRGSQA